MSHGVYKKYGPEHLSILERAVNDGLPISDEDIAEIFRLTRLGLWAEEHGKPLIEFHAEAVEAGLQPYKQTNNPFRKALAALPEKK